MAIRLSRQHPADLVHGRRALTQIRLVTVPSRVRREDRVRKRAERAVMRERLLLVNIEDRRETALAQLRNESLFVHDRTASGVDEQGAVLDHGKLSCGDHVPGFEEGGHVQRYDVATAQEILQTG